MDGQLMGLGLEASGFTAQWKKNPFPNSPSGTRSIRNAGPGYFLSAGVGQRSWRSCDAGLWPKTATITYQFRPAEITGSRELQPVPILPCQMFAARTQFPARVLSSGRNARFHPGVRRPYWYGVITSDSGSLMSAV